MTNLGTLMVFLTLAAPGNGPGADKVPAKIGIQAIEAKPGRNRTDGEIDPRLARKLRRTLEVMGVANPDLADKGRTSKSLAEGESTALDLPPYTVRVTCKSIAAEAVTVTVELQEEYRDPQSGKKVKRTMNKTTVELKGDQVLPLTPAQRGKKKQIFVVTRD